MIRLSNLVLNKYVPLVDKMMKESGDKSCPIWLLVNPKYPVVRDDIWNPILDKIQDAVYRKLRKRIDTRNIFIKNVSSDIGIVPNPLNLRAVEITKEIAILRESVFENNPKILITFGKITYEFVRRVLEISPEEGPKYWSTANLGDEFERSITNFDINQTNKIPLPGRVVRGGKSIKDREYSSWEDSENYFRDIGTKIADRIIENKDDLKIWI